MTDNSKVVQKINNSYESESLSSNGSTNDAGSSNKSIVCSNTLGHLMHNALSNGHINKTEAKNHPHILLRKLITELDSGTCPRKLSSTDSSDFEGFSDGSTKHLKNNKYSSSGSDFEGFSSIGEQNKLPLQQSTGPSSCSESCRFDSDEISNQDVRFQKDIKKTNLDFLLNKHLQEISQFSIEPTSSLEDNDKESNATVMYQEENSCNAVDTPILPNRMDFSNRDNKNALTFDGRIPTNSTYSKIIPPISSIPSQIESTYCSLELNDTATSSRYINEQSPDLFGDDETDDEINNEKDEEFENITIETSTIDAELNRLKSNERKLLNRLQSSLSGVLPPPSVTFLQLDLNKMVSLYNENKNAILDGPFTKNSFGDDCLFHQTHSMDEVKLLQWPQVFNAFAHGVSYNRSSDSEKIELLCMKYAERNIGAETSSSFTARLSPSSSKKRAMRMRMLSQSPGNRLSHLAKRRAVFSSANLMTNSQSLPSSKLGNKPMVIDTRKIERKGRNRKRTPKRYTPNKRRTPGRKTPGSERKRFAILSKSTASTRESSRRALFQSPAKTKPKPSIAPHVAVRVDKSKRVLFSPAHNRKEQSNAELSASFQVPNNNNDEIKGKRKREEDDICIESALKIQKTNFHSTLTNLKLAKSQSFCIGSVTTNSAINTVVNKSLFRASSETSFQQSSINQLSDSHRQKLLWAVSTSLKKKQISSNHEKFKYYASNLAKVVKRLFLETEQKASKTSTSTTLLKLADKMVFWVLQDKNVDEIYLMEKLRLEKVKNALPKLSGYIGPDEYEERKQRLKMSNTSLFSSENSWDSFNLSQASMASSQPINDSHMAIHPDYSQSSFNSAISNKSICNESNSICDSQSAGKIFTDNNAVKLIGTMNSVLRENVDTEQRPKSGQKNVSFSGKNQKNISPYNDRIRSASQTKPNSIFFNNANVLKAKRQITFDA